MVILLIVFQLICRITHSHLVSTHSRYIPDAYPTHTRYIWIPREYSPNIPHIPHEYPIAHSSIVEAWRVPLLKHPQWNISREPGDDQNEQKNENVCEVLRVYFKKMQLFYSKICVFHLFSVILRAEAKKQITIWFFIIFVAKRIFVSTHTLS